MDERTKAAWKNFGIYPRTDSEKRIGLGPRKLWFRYGKRSLHIAFARSRNKHRPVFRLRMAGQRLIRRYDDSMFWSLDHTLAEVTVAGVQNMRKWKHGYPTEFSDDADFPGARGGGWDAWDDILRQIEEGFQAYLDNDGWFHNKPEEEAKFKKAQELQAYWYSGLWD